MTATMVNLPASKRPRTELMYGSRDGMNQRDLQNRLSDLQAVMLENYVVLGDGRIRVREGLSETESFSGIPNFIGFLSSDVVVYGYDDGSNSKLATYTFSTDTSVVVNTFTSQDQICGARYGDYFYASDGTDKIGCIYKGGRFFAYTGASGDFTIGETVTGSTSGAKGRIVADDDNGTSGTLVIDTITGTFQGETITGGTSLKTATISGAGALWYELTNAPACKNLGLYQSSNGTFLVAGNTDTNTGQTKWSEAHILTNINEIPFLGWSADAIPEPDDAGVTLFNAGGKMNSLITHKDYIVTFYDDATSAVKIDVVNVDSVGLAQKTVVQHQEFNFGGYSALSTPFGIFYTNENGVFQMELIGTDKQEFQISDVLGNYIDDIDFSNSSLVWDGKKQILVFCATNGTTNNLCLCYNLVEKAWSTFTGWNIHMGARQATGDKNDVYGVDSISGKLYKLFDGYTDLGLPIRTRFLSKKEDEKDPAMRKNLKNIWLKGKLSPTSQLKVDIHTWDKKGRLNSPTTFYWNGESRSSEVFGYGKTGYGKVTSTPESMLIETNIAHKRRPIRDFLEYQIDIISSAEEPHEIHTVETEIIGKRRTQLDNLSLTA